MKVIFLQNVEDHKVGDIREVAEGYARNYLFKNGIAEVASEGRMKEIEAKLTIIKRGEAENVKKAKTLAEKMSKLKFKLAEEVNEEGHLYGSVGAKEIAEAIAEKGFDIDGADILLEESIKELGEYKVTVKVGHGVETETHVTIERSN